MSLTAVETAAEPSTAGAKPIMPGSFEPGDYIESHHRPLEPGDYIEFQENPFEILAGIQESWRQKGRNRPWSTDKLPELDLEGIEWDKFEPPAALRATPNVTSQILLDIVSSSIENVRAQAAEEGRRREDEEQRRKEGSKIRHNEEEPYLPIIISEDRAPTPPPKEGTEVQEPKTSDDFSSRRAELIQAVSKSHSDKGKKLNIRRLFGRTSGKIASTAERARLEAIGRKYLASTGLEDSGNTISWDPATGTYKRLSAQSKLTIPKPPEPEVEQVECVSCMEDFPSTSVVKVPCHSYCFDCFAGLISTSVQNEQQWPPKCCLNEIPFRTILRYVPEQLKERFQDRSAEWNIPVAERVYCSQADCGIWVKPQNINIGDQEARCDRNHWTCTRCRAPRHPNKTCPQDPQLRLTEQLAEEQGWKRCGKCNTYVEHRDACRHMTCRCGFQFCYVCGAKWCTCSCSGDMLDRIKRDARVKQNAREERERAEAREAAARAAEQAAREAAEAEELRQILAQIEEFEREEALKAEMLRQEQERLEEERRQRELEERVRQESIRRRDLEIKFTELRNALDSLHELQRAMLEEQSEKDARAVAEEAHTARKDLAEKQVQERAYVEAHIQTKMAEKEASFSEDFELRSTSERKMVEDYHGQLKEYWGTKATAVMEIDRAMAPLRERMKQNYLAWQDWKNRELKTYRDKLEEKRAIKEEFMYSAKARMDDQHEERETRTVKQGVAEQKWMHMVVLERERMISEMEYQEIEGDADSLFAGNGDNSEAGGSVVGIEESSAAGAQE